MSGEQPAGRGFGPAGQGIVEYGLILAGAALVALLVLVVFGDQVSAILGLVSQLIEGGG